VTYDQVKRYAKALINYTGTDSRINELESAVKAAILNSHLWERFWAEGSLVYPGGASSYDLDSSSTTKIFHKITAVRYPSTVSLPPPEYITPDEYNRLANSWGSTGEAYPTYYTMIGRSFHLLGVPGASTTFTVTYARDPANVNWGEIPEEFLDYSGTVLARMLTPASTVAANGYPVENPAFVGLLRLEQDKYREVVELEYRQPGRKYEVQQDSLRTLRYEQFDY
jgi:hypothetical protein